MANKLKVETEERKEQIRLLYVALTRAKNYLCLTGTYKLDSISNIKNKDPLKCNSFMELVLYSMLQNSYNFDKLLNDKKHTYTSENLNICTNIVGINDSFDHVYDKNMHIKPNKLMVDIDLVNKLKSDFMYIYPYTKTKDIALKTSVTALNESMDYVEQNEEPKTLKINETMSNSKAILIGNAYHKIMQNVDYKNANNVGEIIKSLILNGQIDATIKSQIKVENINTAINIVKDLITPSTLVFKEQQFIMKNKHKNLVTTSSDDVKVMVQGVIDLLLLSGKEATIIDFKTNKVKDEADLKNKYAMQLHLYKLAVEKAKNVTVKNTYLYSFYLNKLIKM